MSIKNSTYEEKIVVYIATVPNFCGEQVVNLAKSVETML